MTKAEDVLAWLKGRAQFDSTGHFAEAATLLASQEVEIAELRKALIEQRMKPGVRWVIDRLHRRAEEMNHYPAKQWLNSLAFELGVHLNDPAIDLDAAIAKSVAAVLATEA